jgi:hypothetical protein
MDRMGERQGEIERPPLQPVGVGHRHRRLLEQTEEIGRHLRRDCPAQGQRP